MYGTAIPVLAIYLSSYIYIDVNIWPIVLISYLVSLIIDVSRKVIWKEKEEKINKTIV